MGQPGRSRLGNLSGRASNYAPALSILAVLSLGAVSASQAKINGALGSHVGDAVIAALISNGTAIALLGGALLSRPSGRRGLQEFHRALWKNHNLRGWEVLGGVAGGFYALSQTASAAPLGLALFTLSLVCGQAVGGVLLDHFGFGPGRARAASPRRVGAAVLSATGVGIAVGGHLSLGLPLWFLWMPLVAGVGQAWQSAMNGRVIAATGSAIATTAVNYVTGTFALLALLAVRALTNTHGAVSLPAEPALYLGGLFGCAFIVGSVLAVKHTGVLLLGLGIVAGQLCFSLLLDVALPARAPVTLPVIVGACMALLAVLLAYGGQSRALHTNIGRQTPAIGENG